MAIRYGPVFAPGTPCPGTPCLSMSRCTSLTCAFGCHDLCVPRQRHVHHPARQNGSATGQENKRKNTPHTEKDSTNKKHQAHSKQRQGRESSSISRHVHALNAECVQRSKNATLWLVGARTVLSVPLLKPFGLTHPPKRFSKPPVGLRVPAMPRHVITAWRVA